MSNEQAQILLRLATKTKRKIKAAAKAKEMTTAAWIRQTILEKLEHEESGFPR